MRLLKIAAVAAFASFAPLAAFAQGGPVASPLQNGVPTGPSVTGADKSSGLYFGLGRTGIAKHLESGNAGAASTPVLSACGTTPALGAGSTDTAGTVTMGTTATGCVITFGTAYTSAPSCLVVWEGTPLTAQNYTVTATAITTVQTSTSNNKIDYVCVAKSGG